MLAERIKYPIHLGVTEAGGYKSGLIKSSIGIGALINDGIGDTIRVSLTDDPLVEVDSAKDILNALNIEGQSGLNIVTLLGAVRELLGTGAVFGFTLLPSATNMLVFVLAPGAFIVLGYLIAIVNKIKK